MKRTLFCWLLVAGWLPFSGFAQTPTTPPVISIEQVEPAAVESPDDDPTASSIEKAVPPAGGGAEDLSHDECISPEDREKVRLENLQNIEELVKKGILPASYPEDISVVGLDWVLKQAAGFSDPSYWTIGNFVDHDSGASLKDYNCGTRTYNGHKGTDIGIWPFSWIKMAQNQVEIIAGAAGTIINKSDGNFDQNCTCTGSWNAVYIQHSDGSVAWYGHMKTGSLTSKSVGQTVAKGEYLGRVGSSGCSTGPHLHFEFYSNSGQTILRDPWGGPCNSLNGTTTWWSNPKPYVDPGLLKIMTGSAAPYFGPNCPANGDISNASNSFQSGATVYFSSYFRDPQSGQAMNYKIRRPDNTIWQSWTLNPANNNIGGYYWYWIYSLPSNAAAGTWKFEITYLGTTTTHPFTVNAAATCNAPTGLAASNITQTTATIAWNAVSGASNYTVQFLLNGVWTNLSGGPFSGTAINIINLVANTTYTWRVRTNCTNGAQSAWSNSSSFTTPPAASCNAPTGLTAYNITQTTATIAWNAVSGAGNYTVQFLLNGVWTNLSGGPFSNTSVNIINLVANTTYTWRVRTNCTNGAQSAWSNSSSFTTPPAASCNTPTGLTAYNITQTAAAIAWNAVSGASNYTVQFLLNGVWTNLSGGPFSNTSVNIINLVANTTYTWRVRTNCTNGAQSAWSNSSSFTTPPAASCNAPTGLTAYNIGQNTATIAWNSASGAGSYNVQFLINGVWTNLSGGPFSTTSVNIYGLWPSTTYTWRVQTNCTNGQQSTWSGSSSFTTPAAAGCTGGSQYPEYALTPSSNWQYQTLIWGGEYQTMNVTSGWSYIFSYCSADGAVMPFDGEITLLSTANQIIAYVDDYCGTAPRLEWTAGFTGQVHVLLSKYHCLAQSTNCTLAYRRSNPFAGNGSNENELANSSNAILPWNEPAEPAISLQEIEPSATDRTEKMTDSEKEAANHLPVQMSIFPNPADEAFSVIFNHPDDTGLPIQLEAIDQTGRVFFNKSKTAQPGRNEWNLPTADWPTGLCLIRLIGQNGQQFTQKLQISH